MQEQRWRRPRTALLLPRAALCSAHGQSRARAARGSAEQRMCRAARCKRTVAQRQHGRRHRNKDAGASGAGAATCRSRSAGARRTSSEAREQGARRSGAGAGATRAFPPPLRPAQKRPSPLQPAPHPSSRGVTELGRHSSSRDLRLHGRRRRSSAGVGGIYAPALAQVSAPWRAGNCAILSTHTDEQGAATPAENCAVLSTHADEKAQAVTLGRTTLYYVRTTCL